MADQSETVALLGHSSRSTGVTHSRTHCWSVIQNEFHLQNLGFDFHQEDVFYSCQWNWPKVLYLIYRLVLVVYSVTILVLSITVFGSHDSFHKPWPVYLTHWSYTLLTAHFLCAAITTCMHLHDDDNSGEDGSRWMSTGLGARQRRTLPLYLKLNWLIFVLASAAAFIVTGVYFIGLYPQRGIRYLSPADINLHLMNLVLVLLEFAFSAFPVRLLHVVYVVIYGVVYVLFSVIYWAVDHDNVIYPHVLDWNHPVQTGVFLLLFTLIAISLLQLLLFCFYRIRLSVYYRLNSVHSFQYV